MINQKWEMHVSQTCVKTIAGTLAGFQHTNYILAISKQESIENRQCSFNCNFALHTNGTVSPDLKYKSKLGKRPIDNPQPFKKQYLMFFTHSQRSVC